MKALLKKKKKKKKKKINDNNPDFSEILRKQKIKTQAY